VTSKTEPLKLLAEACRHPPVFLGNGQGKENKTELTALLWGEWGRLMVIPEKQKNCLPGEH
jgi:hypothetical protein